MKSYLFIICMCCLPAAHIYGQNDIAREIWNLKDPYFKLTQSPERWKSAKVLILCKWHQYEYGYRRSQYYKKEFVRLRMKLQDSLEVLGLKEFPIEEITNQWGKEIIIGIKVIKPNGTQTSELLSPQKIAQLLEKPAYTSSQQRQITYPINIQVEDILDYFIYLKKSFERTDAEAAFFAPEYYFLQESYPILRQKLTLLIDDRTYLSAKSVNGAPDLIHQEERPEYFVETLNQEALPKEPIWFAKHRSVPLVKFQVSFHENGLQGEKGKLRSRLEPADIIAFAEALSLKTSLAAEFERKFDSYLQKTGKQTLPPLQIIEEAYYFFKNYTFFEIFEQTGLPGKSSSFNFMDFYFISIFSTLLQRYQIEYAIVFVPPKQLCRLEDWVLFGEPRVVLQVRPDNFYIQLPSLFSEYKQVSSEIQDTDGYAVYKHAVRKLRLPKTGSLQNFYHQQTEVTFPKNNLSVLQLKRVNRIEGEYKENFTLLLNPVDMIMASMKTYTNTMEMQKTPEELFKDDIEIYLKLTHQQEEYNKDLRQHWQRVFEKQLGRLITSLDRLEVKKEGINHNDRALIFEDEFTISTPVDSLSNSLVIGKLIGSLPPMPDTLARQNDIWLPAPFTTQGKLFIQLPRGYTAKNSSEWKLNFENNIGTIQCNYEFIQRPFTKLTIQWKISHKEHYLKASYWPEVLKFYKKLYEFYNKKLIIKKS